MTSLECAAMLRQKAVAPDFIKIAQRLVRAVDHGRQRQQQIQSIVRAGNDLGCQIIAVGIRSQGEADTLRQLGCRWGQGRLCGVPRPIHGLLKTM